MILDKEKSKVKTWEKLIMEFYIQYLYYWQLVL